MEPEHKPRELSFIRELVPEWRPTRKHRLWTVRIAIVLIVVLGLLTLIGLPFGITLWEWANLLIVPAVIAAGGLWFNRQQRERELEIADRRAQDEALQAYFDQMSQLLLDKDRPLRQSKEGDEVQTLARARTLAVLRRLDGERKGRVLQFLYESALITRDHVVVDLRGADLSGANLKRADLRGADLNGTNLSEAVLSGANLSSANVTRTILSKALLDWTRLKQVDLTNTNLVEANFMGPGMGDAAKRLGVEGQLRSVVHAPYLEGATMPNGQPYEEWRKSRGEDGESSGPS